MAEAVRGQRRRLCMAVMSSAVVPQDEEQSLAWLPSASVAMVTARRRLRAVVNAQLKRPTLARPLQNGRRPGHSFACTLRV